MEPEPLEFAVVGGLREDYFITPTGETHLHKMGGNALYAAAGVRLWTKRVGLVSRVGENYPREWLDTIQQRGVDIEGIKIVNGALDTRTFYAYPTSEERIDTDPASHFARVGQPLPDALANYTNSTEGQESRTQFGPLAARPTDLPAAYFNAKGFHLAPYDFIVHHTFPSTLRSQRVRYITCDPSTRYMQPAFVEDVKEIVRGLDAFLPSEMEARGFFTEKLDDAWQAAEAFGAMGAKIVLIKLGARGQYLYDALAKRKWHIPAYPAKVKDVTGAGDAYCGGFLVGLSQTDDPVEAALCGAVSASIVIEGIGALYAFSSTPGLAEARRQSLRDSIRPI